MNFISKGLFQKHIVTSLLDTDAYKLHMMQAVWERYPSLEVEYEFICRSEEDLTELCGEIKTELQRLADLRFSDDQISYLRKISFMKPAFLDVLRNFRLDPARCLSIGIENDQLFIRCKGSWFATILFEIPVLAIVSEVRNRRRFPDMPDELNREILYKKTRWLKQAVKDNDLEGHFFFADFGTRRRFSARTQSDMVQHMKREVPAMFVGSSNYHLAKEYGINAIGTQAHEWFQAHQSIVNVKNSLFEALEAWNRVYRGRLGIALTDCITTDAFLENFDYMFSKLFDGVRHDSGCPFVWGEKFITHYEKQGIDPLSKTLVFSDSLDFELAIKIACHFKGRIKTSFGIGTFLSNDMGDYVNQDGVKYKPLNIVMKMTQCDGSPVAKISDEPGKSICKDPAYLANLKRRFNVPA
ncbi:nicotinate phosphoribosyltransferase [Photobacterium japonica]|uniref:nicotinate phosphoribosyltransferase n=1 Tax=Photobacterium japonica TaxID=2910235 RepID=UPI003D1229B5